MTRIWQFAAVMASGLSLAGLSLDGDTAHAGPSYQGGDCPSGVTCTRWCPGDPPLPGSSVVKWDWNICHSWYWNSEGVVDVAANVIYPWHGVPHEAPPAPLLPPAAPAPPPFQLPADCPTWSPILAPSRCGGL